MISLVLADMDPIKGYAERDVDPLQCASGLKESVPRVVEKLGIVLCLLSHFSFQKDISSQADIPYTLYIPGSRFGIVETSSPTLGSRQWR